VSQFIFERNGNIKEAHHHLDEQNKHFFMRIEIESNLACSFAAFQPTGKFFEFIMVRQNTNNLSFHF
jgi:formyltetrahydrofolate hydrolase